ncbi:NADP-dependent oxidoreductase [Streptomyces sp. ME19-01-6]|uniref:NADP-dependent oxidoreductase n=1 Tax=Streptomyces sp. ME19-01-6 TaxID=3028686 RepID=UPI0029BB5441|nr:NADP-dependent oxidoreductase [Streptomyces sp. ME19-01-6]MDX3227531.1 NADP-dependent oxidoreductase [Streptomyces sp. ME19-01-6]
MRAVSQRVFGGPDVLEIIETERPEPGPDEVLVRVHAVGVNPADWKGRSGLLPRLGEPPFTLGLDLAGVVETAGERVTGFRPGEAVFAAVLPPRAYAEYVAVPQEALAPVPAGLDLVRAAALPTAALTAWQPLARVAGVRAGQRVLVHAAAGGIGHLAVQIAKDRGAYVIGTARRAKHGFLQELGADELVDYTSTDFVAAAAGVDVVLDPISGEYGLRSLDALAPGGVLIDIRGTGPDRDPIRAKAGEQGRRYVEFGFTASGADLREIGALVERGVLRVAVEEVLPLQEVAKAHELSESGRVTGKIVLTVR